jgi:hypothetical protein
LKSTDKFLTSPSRIRIEIRGQRKPHAPSIKDFLYGVAPCRASFCAVGTVQGCVTPAVRASQMSKLQGADLRSAQADPRVGLAVSCGRRQTIQTWTVRKGYGPAKPGLNLMGRARRLARFVPPLVVFPVQHLAISFFAGKLVESQDAPAGGL